MNRPHEDERLSWPCWLTYSERFTHINGYPPAAGPAQTSESSPVRDRRSTTEPPNQLLMLFLLMLQVSATCAAVVTASSSTASTVVRTCTFSRSPLLAVELLSTAAAAESVSSSVVRRRHTASRSALRCKRIWLSWHCSNYSLPSTSTHAVVIRECSKMISYHISRIT